MRDPEQPKYCCFGCKLAHGFTQERGEQGEAQQTLTRVGIALFLTMNVMVCTLALWGFDTGGFDVDEQLAATFAELLRFTTMLLALPVLFLLGQPILSSALQQLRGGILSTDLLLIVGVGAAFGFSILSVWQVQLGYPPGPIYFEVGCMILVMVTLGRWFEAIGKLRSTRALDQLQRLLPDEVHRVDSCGQVELVSLSAIQIGDTIHVAASERIPVDGQLVSSSATLDEQLVTGESWPVEKHSGDSLSGGTLNISSELRLVVTALPNEGTLARLIAAVRQARLEKGTYERLADRISQWFFPIMLTASAVTFAGHWIYSGPWAGLMAGLSVILIACPCALGLATPMAIWAAMGAAARRGVVFRSPEALERLAQCRAIRFDKTGTLTTGSPEVHHVEYANSGDVEEVRHRVAVLTRTSQHVFSKAILGYLRDTSHGILEAKHGLTESHQGKGVTCRFGDESDVTGLGSLRFLEELGMTVPSALRNCVQNAQANGEPMVVAGWNGEVHVVFVLKEQLRPATGMVATWARQRNLDVGVLTGDHHQSANRVASQLGWAVSSELTPSQKEEEIQSLTAKTEGGVIFVGDGVNDAPALASSTVGITLGCGADLTRDSADVCLVENDLAQIPWLVDLSTRTIQTVRSNLYWCLGYNMCGVAIAATGWLHPAVAAVLMVASSLYVISNSLRLAGNEVDFDDKSVVEGVTPLAVASNSVPQEQLEPEGMTV
ncbi:MAG: cation-translocating P-type ATPase [Planctomycetaceae bacterium]